MFRVPNPRAYRVEGFRYQNPSAMDLTGQEPELGLSNLDLDRPPESPTGRSRK